MPLVWLEFLLDPGFVVCIFHFLYVFVFRGGVVSPTPKPQPGGAVFFCFFLSGPSPVTCLAWLNLPGALIFLMLLSIQEMMSGCSLVLEAIYGHWFLWSDSTVQPDSMFWTVETRSTNSQHLCLSGPVTNWPCNMIF